MSVPTALKSVTPWITRAKELEQADPVMSYWCTLYAVQTGMGLGSKDNDVNKCLMNLMDKLETLKQQQEGNEAVSDDVVASAYVENFALKVFLQADNEDRAGKATRLTAKKFLAAANFLEVLGCFGEGSTETREKVKYAKWKASDITKAFKEGRTPVPGPPGGLEQGAPEQTADEILPSEANELKKELLSPESDSAEPPSYPFPVQPSAPPASTTGAGEDDEDQERMPTPTAPDFVDEDPAATLGTIETPSAVPQTHQTSELVTPPPSDQAFAHAVFPSQKEIACPTPPPPPTQPTTAPKTAPIQPPPTSAYAHVQQPQPVVPIVAATGPSTLVMDPTTVTKIQKHCKWAISALNYEDAATARKELRAALALLGDA